MSPSRPLCAAVLAVVLAMPARAQPTQLDARDEPTVAGALTLQDRQCDRDERTFEGAVVATARICLFLYSFDPASETDPNNDYKVLWAQSNVNAADGWCSVKVHTEVFIPADMPVHAMAPPEGTITERSVVTTKLDVTANDTALEGEAGAVTQDVILYPGELLTARKTPTPETQPGSEPSPDVVRLTWKGRQDRRLGFALGLEVSIPAGEPTPPIGFGLRYPIQQTPC